MPLLNRTIAKEWLEQGTPIKYEMKGTEIIMMMKTRRVAEDFVEALKRKGEIIDETQLIVEITNGMKLANTSLPIVKAQIINALKIEGRRLIPKEINKKETQFKGKIINIETGEEKEATKEYFTFNPIPWKIGETEETPTIDKLIKSWVKEEDVQKIYEWIAYHIINEYPIHRVMVLNGSGSNGKSTLLTLIRRFIGEENIAANNFTSVFIQRFGTTALYKKMGLFIPEADYQLLEETGTYKSATGDDIISVEFKNKNFINYKNTAKVTISTNSLSPTKDKTDGFYRRHIIVDFPHRFTEKYDVLREIPEKEYENLAKKSIRIAKELLERATFTNEGTVEEKKERYERRSNPLMTFIEEEVIESGDEYITKSEFFKKTNQWLKEKGHRQLENREINKIMRENYQEAWREQDKRTERAWLGIGWKKDQQKITEERIQ